MLTLGRGRSGLLHVPDARAAETSAEREGRVPGPGPGSKGTRSRPSPPGLERPSGTSVSGRESD